MKKKKRRKVRNLVINQNSLIRLLMILLVILAVLVIIYVFVYKLKVDEATLRGELGTLCIFCQENLVELEVLNYTIVSGNLSISVEVNWTGGDISIIDFNSIFVDLGMVVGANCNITSLDLPSFGENKTYTFDVADFNLGCAESDYSNVTSVSVYAEVDIPLTQTTIPLPDITFYSDDSRNNLIHFDEYFTSLVEINYSIVESPSNDKITVVLSNISKNLSISSLDSVFDGTQKFNLTAISADGEVLNVGNSGNNMSFNIIINNETRPVANYAPEFDMDYCEEFLWVENTNRTIDMDYCWDDEDDDSLTYEYGDLHDYEDNISITRLSGNRLKFAPDRNFNGSTYLYLYANDSKVRVSQRVDIRVSAAAVNVSSGNDSTSTISDTALRIKSSNPPSSRLSFSIDEDKVFAINAENYENIEWYVDEELKREGVLSYRFEETTPGDYLIEVKIINGTRTMSKTWDVTIQEEEEEVKDKILDINIGQVVFYLIVSILVIIILLVVWLFIVEKNKKNKKVDLGFGISVVPNSRGGNSSSSQFNIPKE